jgi:hypothetical protein
VSDSLGRQTAIVRPLGQGVLVHSAQYQDVLNIRHFFLGEVKVVKSGPKAGTKYSGGFHSRYSILPGLKRIREADSLAGDAATNKRDAIANTFPLWTQAEADGSIQFRIRRSFPTIGRMCAS